MSQTKAQLVSGTTAQDLTVDNINTTSINSGQTSGRKNLVINGAMQVAQRGTSNTNEGYRTVDRFRNAFNGTDEAPTQEQVDVVAGTTPYTLGFRKSYKLTNGNQTGGAGATDYLGFEHHIEAQNVATSGWNFKSASSKLTLSFWIKSSVAQAFSGSIETPDSSPARFFKFTTASLSADTWTKVTLQIPGDSNLNVDMNTSSGLAIRLYGFIGTTYSSSDSDTETWVTGSNRYANTMTTTWYTTNDATLEITGVQLEVGSTATDFEHRSFADELALCQRYYYLLASGATKFMCMGDFWIDAQADGGIVLPVEMRATPTLDHTNGADYYRVWTNGTNSHIDGAISLWNRSHNKAVTWYATPDANRTAGHSCRWITNNASTHFAFSAEL